MLPLVYTYAHIHLVLLVRVHLCCLCSFVPNAWGADSVVLLPVRGGGPDTKLQSRCSAACHVVVSTIVLVRVPLSQEWFRYRVLMLVVSAQRGKWVGGVETKRRLNVGVLVWQCLGSGGSEGGLSQWASSRSGYRNAMDQVECGQADARASCTGLCEPFHTSVGRCCGNKVVTRRV
jgi:hypothetical protein